MENTSVFKIRLRDYDHVAEMANFVYVGPSGSLETMSIHKNTFEKLATKGAWDSNKYGSPTSQQKNFLDILKSEVKGDLIKWYEEVTNEFMKIQANKSQK